MSWVDPLNPGALPPGEPEEIPSPNADLAASEAGYYRPTVEADQAAIAEQVFTNLATRAPGWAAHDSSLDTWMIEAWAEVGAEIRALAADVPASIFQVYGANVLGIPPDIATAATGFATFTARDGVGYTLDAGSQFGLARSGTDIVAFATLQQVTIPENETVVYDVPFAAVETGAGGNGLSGAGQMLDPIYWVQDVSVTLPTATGQDAETAEDYLNRLSSLMRMIAVRPVLPLDFAIICLEFHSEVGRAIAMNLYNPDTGTWNNARTVTLILANAEGEPVGDNTKAAIRTQLEALRELNWALFIRDATYEDIDVTFSVTPFTGQDAATVNAQCVANVTAFLSPANYRLGELSPAISGGEVINAPLDGVTIRRPVIRVNDIIALLDNSLGVDFVNTVQINGAANDVTLTDPYSLPRPGVITAT